MCNIASSMWLSEMIPIDQGMMFPIVLMKNKKGRTTDGHVIALRQTAAPSVTHLLHWISQLKEHERQG